MSEREKTAAMLLVAWGYGGLAALFVALHAFVPFTFVCFSGLILGMWIAARKTKD
jgi:hypothetical protein